MDQQRFLAAILFTDVVGYTAMMQQNEVQAVAAIKRHNTVLERISGQYHGKVVNFYGDGCLCIFPSAMDAMQTALEVQMELQKDPSVPIRIGLHIGEVSLEEGKALGDGVNIASRIQSLGQAQTILFSKEIFDKIRNHPEFKAVSLGTFDFKNVNEPMEVFALANEGLRVPKRNEMEGKLKSSEKGRKARWIPFSLAGAAIVLASFMLVKTLISHKRHSRNETEKSIAVLPFTNMSNDKDQEYFSEGITDDILDHLVKIADLKVKSRTSTLQYKGTTKTIPQIADELGVSTVLEGSVRKSGNQVRIVVQLIDSKTDEHIFSQTYDREIKDVFSTQSEIAMEIADALQARLSENEKENINTTSSHDITAYDYFLKARSILFNSFTDRKSGDDAITLLRHAIALDSNYAAAYALMGLVYNVQRMHGLPREIWLDSALALAQKSIQLDPKLVDGYLTRINIYADQGRTQDAEDDLKKAYMLAPNNGFVMDLIAQDFSLKGDYRQAAIFDMKAFDRIFTKKDPQYYTSWGYLYLLAKDYARAEQMVQQAINLDPRFAGGLSTLALIYFQQQEYAKSAETLEKYMVINNKDQGAIDQLAWSYYLSGDLKQAAFYWSKYKELEAGFTDTTQFLPYRHRLAYIKWKQGDKAEAKKLFDEQLGLDKKSISHQSQIGVWSKGSDAYDYAIVNAFLGNKDLAYQWLDTALSKRFYVVWLLDKDPLLDGIRKEKKFQDYVRRVHALDNDAARTAAYRKALKDYESGQFNNGFENAKID